MAKLPSLKLEFSIGRELGESIQAMRQEMNRPPNGKLWPLFIDCKGSSVWVGKATGSKECRDQVKVSADTALDFANTKNTDATRNTILAA
ncbi:hypothetical protein LX32DRAFT_693439 [Colletotrichum zoysiae]|uniref:Uncharacterized protein n=1 Tax=Colletotrichum zoysiae TaxID=1216348 RepID=A0AAD9M0B3_9PEZI|nr:hypothetical protein LX32DRAFT_693439 [Colletotrichum zoysiae]